MISLDEINSEIAKLEAQPSTYAIMERLAWLYIVRDHITLSAAKHTVSPANRDTVPEAGTSAFLLACAGKPVSEVMQLMDELMATLQTLHPRLYEAVLAQL